MTFTSRIAVLMLTVLVWGCTDGEEILPGERLTPRAALGNVEGSAESNVAGPRQVAISLPGMSNTSEWSHRAGNAAHAPGNAAFGGSLNHVWAADIGEGDSRRNRIVADPIVAGGRVFTLDSANTVTATGTNGATLWQINLAPEADKADDASGGGIAYGDGTVFVTTGFGELVAISATTGSVLWRQKFSIAVGGAPTVSGGQVYTVTRDGGAWAVSTRDGHILWAIPGTPAQAGVAGVSAPAVSSGTVVFPFASGQVIAAKVEDGAVLWDGFVAGERLGRAYAISGDLSGDPVIAGSRVYAGSASGRMTAFDLASGAPAWTAYDGAASPAVVAGGSVFMVNDENQLVRLDAQSGAVIWRVDLPYFTKAKDKRRARIYAQYGPVLAGGRLIIASTDGLIRAFDPASGNLMAQVELPDGAASAPVVAGGTLYVVSKSGELHAFR